MTWSLSRKCSESLTRGANSHAAAFDTHEPRAWSMFLRAHGEGLTCSHWSCKRWFRCCYTREKTVVIHVQDSEGKTCFCIIDHSSFFMLLNSSISIIEQRTLIWALSRGGIGIIPSSIASASQAKTTPVTITGDTASTIQSKDQVNLTPEKNR